MTAMPVTEDKAALVSQCLDFCQTLASKSPTFSFTLTIFKRRRRRKLHPPWEEMPEEDPSFWRKNWKSQLVMPHLRVKAFLKKKPSKRLLKRKFSSVNNVRISSNRKMAWRSMLVKLTKKWTQSHQHLISWGSSWWVQWASQSFPSWTPAGRSPASTQLPWRRTRY